MELDRLRLLIGARWRVLLVLVVAGFTVALITTMSRNGRIEPEFIAAAAVVYAQESSDERSGSVLPSLEAAQERAYEATEELFVQTPGAAILIEGTVGELLFQAVGPDGAGAREAATSLRDVFLESETVLEAEELDQEIAFLEDRITEVELQIADLITPTAGEVVNEQRIASLTSQIDDLTGQANRLRVEAVTATVTRTPEVIQQELTAVEGRILELEAERVRVPRPDPAEQIREDVRANALARQVQGLEAQYVDLFLRRAALTEGGRPGAITITDATTPERSVIGSGLLGAVLGLVLGVGGLVASERFRPMVWLARDSSPLASFGLIPPRSGSTEELWYLAAGPGPRKTAIQRMRAMLEARLASSKMIAFAGVTADPEQVRLLALDVAASLSATGRRVLVVQPLNAGIGSPGSEPVSIMDVLQGERQLDSVLSRAVVDGDLHVIGPADAELDPDLVASAGFRIMLEKLAQRFDAVIVVAGGADSAIAQSLLQQTRAALIIVPPGSVSVEDFGALATDLRERSVAVLGLAMIGAGSYRAAPVWEPSRWRLGRIEAPTPLQSRSPSSSTGDRAVKSELDPEEPAADQLILQLIDALEESEPYRVVDSIEEFLQERVVGLVESAARWFDEGRPVEPFVWLGPGSQFTDDLVADLESEFGAESAQALSGAMSAVLQRSLAIPTFEAWARERFFESHLRAAHGAPVVWALTEDDWFAVLVSAGRLSSDHLEAIRTRTRMAVAYLENGLKRMDRSERSDAESTIESMQLFDLKLGTLLEGSIPEARIRYPEREASEQPNGWKPDFSSDPRFHLAPLQRMGLVQVQVLDKDDLGIFVGRT
jgi:hypothetical protein